MDPKHSINSTFPYQFKPKYYDSHLLRIFTLPASAGPEGRFHRPNHFTSPVTSDACLRAQLQQQQEVAPIGPLRSEQRLLLSLSLPPCCQSATPAATHRAASRRGAGRLQCSRVETHRYLGRDALATFVAERSELSLGGRPAQSVRVFLRGPIRSLGNCRAAG